LQEQKEALLTQLNPVSQELNRRCQEYDSSVSERKLLLDTLIVDIEKKRDQPVVEFLMSSCPVVPPFSCETAKAPLPDTVSPELQRTAETLSETCQLVLGTVAKFKGKARAQTDLSLCHPLEKVTLDPETASPHLNLSPDHKTVRLGDGQQKVPDTPRRFTGSPSVLGSQG
ncbi:TRI15 protein, partial [Calyptomena viridis]|nr:TRI15 protein [Calyptomena viridis]